VVSGKVDKTLWQQGPQFEYLRDSIIPGKKLTVENDGELSEKACRSDKSFTLPKIDFTAADLQVA